MKYLLNLKGVKALSKMEQKSINGGEMSEGGSCTVTCNSGSQYSVPNCDGAPDGACHSTGWSICSCLY